MSPGFIDLALVTVLVAFTLKGFFSGFFRSDDEGSSFARINDDAHQYGGSNVIIGDPRVYGRAYIAPGGRGILYGEPR